LPEVSEIQEYQCMNERIARTTIHPLGEPDLAPDGRIAVETFGGRVHVEWAPQAAVTPLGQLPIFIEFLKTSE
jgi:hypothetical protein